MCIITGEVRSFMERNLEKLHEVELEILVEVDRICRKYGINYFLDSGSALGAIRHKGFIPWDDDIDIGMLRKDYVLFIQVAEKELAENFFLQTSVTDINYNKLHAKVRKNNTLFIENATSGRDMHQGIFIDIFPFDNVPDYGGLLYIRVNQFLQKLVVYQLNEKYEKIARYKIFLSRLVLGKNPQKRFDKFCNLFNNKDTKNITSFSYIDKEQLPFLREWFINTDDVLFEGRFFKIMRGWDGYLKRLYGDYMALPPIEKRQTHNALKVEVGEHM